MSVDSSHPTSCYQELYKAVLGVNVSGGQTMSSDANLANTFMTQYNDYQSAWASDGVPPAKEDGSYPENGQVEKCQYGYQIYHSLLYFGSDSSQPGTSKNDKPGKPLSGYNYSNAQIQMQMSYCAAAAQGQTGDALTEIQIILNQWSTVQSEMSALQGVGNAPLKNNVDTYTSQLQLDQSNQQAANSALSSTLGDLMGSGASALGQGIV